MNLFPNDHRGRLPSPAAALRRPPPSQTGREREAPPFVDEPDIGTPADLDPGVLGPWRGAAPRRGTARRAAADPGPDIPVPEPEPIGLPPSPHPVPPPPDIPPEVIEPPRPDALPPMPEPIRAAAMRRHVGAQALRVGARAHAPDC